MSVQTRRAESGHWWVAALATRLVTLFLNLLHASLRRSSDQPHTEGQEQGVTSRLALGDEHRPLSVDVRRLPADP